MVSLNGLTNCTRKSFKPGQAQVDLFVTGFPCVSLSPLTVTPGSVMDASCQSGSGFQAVKSYCERYRPPMVLLENVASLFHKRQIEGEDTSAYLCMDIYIFGGHYLLLVLLGICWGLNPCPLILHLSPLGYDPDTYFIFTT